MERQSPLRHKLRRYVEGSSTPLFGAMMSIPLVLLYEAGLHWTRASGVPLVRNGVDVAFRAVWGGRGWFDLGVAVGAGAVVVTLWGSVRGRWHVQPIWVGLLILECVGWALAVLLFVRLAFGFYVAALGYPMLATIGFLSGAAVFEELAFRVAVLGGLRLLFERLQAPRWVTWNASLWTSSFSFAAAHYYGPLGQPLSAESLFSHIVVGLAFGIVYLIRGFAAAAYTHAFYDWFLTLAT